MLFLTWTILVSPYNSLSFFLLQYNAIYDFDGQDASELSFKKGDVITVVAKDDADWWKGLVIGMQSIVIMP